MIEMKVSGIVLDPQSRSPIVVLRDMPERRALMIWIGPPEANAIMLAIENVPLARPATHDLLVNSIQHLGGTVHSVVVNRMEENTFFAVLRVNTKAGKQIEIDSRPSDAVAVALRTESPIFVAEEVMATSSIPINPAQEEQEAKDFRDFIQNIKPSDFIDRTHERGDIN
ncbi:MAG: bifunctional nuclease family protein [Candidatus Sericytochromatia bacterium]|nr:bifunctional nuclease family protein [Candidatus Sericytochromatia bacterium]